MLPSIQALVISVSVVLASSALMPSAGFAQSAPRGEAPSSTMGPGSGNNDGGSNGIGTAGSTTGNNGTASSTINPGNSSLAASPKPAAAPNRGTSGTLENDPSVGGGSQGAGTSK